MSKYARRIAAATIILGALGAAACSSDSDDDEVAPVNTTVTVIGESSEQGQLLAEMYAEALERSGLRVARRADVADLAAGYAAVNSGAADLFVTHTGDFIAFLAAELPEAAASTSTTTTSTTTTTTIAETSTTLAETSTTGEGTTSGATTTAAGATDDTADIPTSAGDASSTSIDESSTTTTISIVGQAASLSINGQVAQIGEILPDNMQLGAASMAEDKPVIACTNAVATTGYLSTLTDAARAADVLRLAATSDWATGDPFGAPGFEAVYDAEFTTVVEVGADEIGDAITAETPEVDATSTTTVESTTTTTIPASEATKADCGAFASSLDATMPADAVVMDDDKNWIRTNGVLPLMSATQYALMSSIVDQVSQTLSTATLRGLLTAVKDGTAVATVVDSYLTQNGIGS